MKTRAIRVAVVRPADRCACHPRLDASRLEIVAEVGALAEMLRAPIHEHDAALVGCTPAQLLDPLFRSQLARLARRTPTVLVPRHLTRMAAMVAGRARVLGLIERDSAPERIAQVVRSVVRRRVAYPPESLAVLLRLVPAPSHRPMTAAAPA
jgi:hypothetical protein